MAFLSTASLSVKLSMIVFEGDTAMGLMYALAKEDELQSLEVADGLQTYVSSLSHESAFRGLIILSARVAGVATSVKGYIT